MRLTTCLTTLAIGLVLASCGPSSNTVTTAGGTVTTSNSTDGGTVTTVKGANGEVVQIGGDSNGAATAALPGFLPLYPGAKVTASISAPDASNADMKSGSVAFDTKATVAEIIAFYKQKAAGQGLAEGLNTSDKDSTMFMAMKDKTMVQVIASKGSDATNVVLSFTAPK